MVQSHCELKAHDEKHQSRWMGWRDWVGGGEDFLEKIEQGLGFRT